MKPLIHTCSSANIDWYSEKGLNRQGEIFAEVLTDSLVKENGRWRARRVPRYSVTIYKQGVGEIARTKYHPNRRPAELRLAPRTVARIVRSALDATSH